MSASEEQSQGPVIRDRRRIDPVTGQPRDPNASSGTAQAGTAQAGTAQAGTAQAGTPPRGTGQPRPGKHAVSKPGGPRAETAEVAEAAGNGEAGTTGTSAPDPAGAGQVQPSGDGGDAGPAGAAPASSRDVAIMLAERTADLQRLQAEYVNYRKRVERDRAAVREQSLAAVLTELLPVLDDIGRAREHGELTGGFKSVAESLEAAATKLGLTTYGEIGEVFDPNVHEALMHAYSPDVAETTCVQILQPGYKVGERILRPARVAVAEPADPAGARTASGETTSGGNADNDGPTGPASAEETGDRAPDDTD